MPTLGLIEQQFKCAILIQHSRFKWSRNTLSSTFHTLGMIDVFIPHHQRKPIPHLWELFFAHSPPQTYSQHINQYNCWTGLLEYTSQEDDTLIHNLLTGKTKWISIHVSNNSHTPHFSHSTRAQESTSSTNLTPQQNNQRTSLDRLHLLMATVLAKASNTSFVLKTSNGIELCNPPP